LGFILLTTAGSGEKPEELARRRTGVAVTDVSVGLGAVQVRGAF
jgi:hypothetical protein